MPNLYLDYLKNKGRLSVWIITFFALLLLVPMLMSSKSFTSAKIVGVLVLVLIVVALWLWRVQTKKKALRFSRVKMTTNEKFWLLENIPFYKNLLPKQKIVFEDRVGIFLAEITITEVGKEIPEKSTCLYVASSAVIAYWGLPYWNYGELNEVLVYPSNFNNDNTLSADGNVLGKVHHGGLMDATMILSLPALIKGFEITNDKMNVGVHEFAHLLDKADGSIDGLPFMMTKEDRKVWSDLVEREIKRINNGNSNINPYGATNEAEFFAVITEYYKERPRLLKNKHPEIYEMLESIFSK